MIRKLYLRHIKRRILRFIIPYCKSWGAEFESDLPPEFIITNHAQRRLEERFKCDKIKYKKITMKAWFNKEALDSDKIRHLLKRNDVGKVSYKTFNGFIFVFKFVYIKRLAITQKHLVTVYNPKVVSDYYM